MSRSEGMFARKYLHSLLFLTLTAAGLGVMPSNASATVVNHPLNIDCTNAIGTYSVQALGTVARGDTLSFSTIFASTNACDSIYYPTSPGSGPGGIPNTNQPGVFAVAPDPNAGPAYGNISSFANGSTTVQIAADAPYGDYTIAVYHQLNAAPWLLGYRVSFSVVNPNAQSSDSTLTGISLSAGTLSPTFSSTVTSYTTYRPSTDTSISVTPTFTGTGESVKINGSPTASNSPVGVYVGSTRPATITLVATAQDNTTTTYTITVAAPATSYTFTGPNSGAVSTNSSNFTITPVGGGYNGTISIAVSGGGLSTTITKTFANSSSAQTFIVTPTGVGTVTLTPTASPSLGTNPAALSYVSTAAKSLSIGTLSAAPQATVPSTSTYPVTTVSIADGQGVSISWFASDGTTSMSSPIGISISGSNVSSNASLLTVTTLNNSMAGNYYFKATSDGTTSALKTLTVSAAPVLATTSTLSGISIFGTTLSPAFNSSTASYIATVDNSVASISVTPSFLGTGETSTVNGVQTTSGTSSSLINLAVGTNTITVVGTAQDGSTTTYTITVTRSVSSGNGTPAPAPAPDPVQTNSINNGSTTVSGPIGGGDCTINGNFGSAVTNVSIDGTLLPKTSWNQTSASVTITMPPHDEGTVSIQIFDGQAPLLAPVTYKYLSNPSATSAPSTNSPAGSTSTSGTSTSEGNGAATPTPTPSANPTPPAKSDSATSTSTPSAKKEKAVLSYSYNSAKTTVDIKTFLSALAITPTSKISIAGYAQPTAPSDDLRISKDRAMKLKEAILALYPKVQVEVSANGSKKEALCENSSNRCAVVTILKK